MMRSNYWSNSTFAKKVKSWAGIENPVALTSTGWRDWEKVSKSRNKFVYWFTEEFLDSVQNFVMWPFDQIKTACRFWNNVIVEKMHTLQTGLPYGYHEVDERMLHGMFNTLVVFVEQEKAWMEYIWNHDKYDLPWYKTVSPFHNFFKFRYPDLGLTYLKWESQLKVDESWGVNSDQEGYGELTEQAIKAIEIMELYHWWKVIRPARVDLMEASGWSAYCAKKREESESLFEVLDDDGTDVKEILDETNRIEAEYEQEDEDMLIRLVKIRRGLWT